MRVLVLVSFIRIRFSIFSVGFFEVGINVILVLFKFVEEVDNVWEFVIGLGVVGCKLDGRWFVLFVFILVDFLDSDI